MPAPSCPSGRLAPRVHLQIVLRWALAAMRWTGALGAIPGMVFLVVLLAAWALPAVVILGGLLVVQLPVYWFCRLLAAGPEPQDAP